MLLLATRYQPYKTNNTKYNTNYPLAALIPIAELVHPLESLVTLRILVYSEQCKAPRRSLSSAAETGARNLSACQFLGL